MESMYFSYSSSNDDGVVERTIAMSRNLQEDEEGMLQHYLDEFDYFLKSVGFMFDHIAVLNKDSNGRNEEIRLVSNP